MKTISKRFLKGGLALLLAFVMLFGTTLTGFAAVVEVADTGYTFSSGTVFYFDNTYAKFTASVLQLMVGHSGYSKGYTGTKIANTNLYRFVVSDYWGDATQFAIFGNSSAWGEENNNISHRKNYASQSSNVYNMTGNYSGTFILYTTSTATMTLVPNFKNSATSGSNSYNSADNDQKAYVYAAASGSSTYSANSKAGTVKVSGYHMTNITTTSSNSASSTLNSTTSATVSLARSSTVTLTATPASGYEFVGWFTSASGGTAVSTDTTYTYTQSGADSTSHYARFQAIPTYTVTYDANGGTGAPSAESGIASGGSHTVSSTVPTQSGKDFVSWNTKSDGNGTSYASGETISNITANITLYAQWKDSGYTYTASAGEGGTVAPESGTATSATITATPDTGYEFVEWVTNANATQTSTSTDANGVATGVFTISANGATIQAVFQKKQYTITANAETGGTATVNGGASATISHGDEVTLLATANTGYRFHAWELNGREVAFTAEFTVAPEDNVTYTATFYKTWNVNVVVPEGVSLVKIATTVQTSTTTTTPYVVNSGTTSTPVATVKDGYRLTGWKVTKNGTTETVADGTTITFDADTTIEPVVVELYNVTVSGATATGTGYYAKDDTVTLTVEDKDGQYMTSATASPATALSVDSANGTITFTMPASAVTVTPVFSNYSYIEIVDSEVMTITGSKTAYKANEAVTLTLAPKNSATTISGLVSDYDGAVIADNNDGTWTVTIASMPADTTITLTPTIDAKFAMKSKNVAIGNFGTGYTTYGTVTMSIDGTTLAEGGYADKTDTVKYEATAATNFTFVGFYSDEACTKLITYDSTCEVTPTDDTTVYALFARNQYMAFDQGNTQNYKTFTYDKTLGAYTLTTTLAEGDSTADSISKSAWFRVTNQTSDWSTNPSYHNYNTSDFTVDFNQNGYGATVGWADGSDAWKLSTSGDTGSTITFILTPTGNTAIDISAKVTKEGATIYLSSGWLSMPGDFNSASAFTSTVSGATTTTCVHNIDGTDHNTETYTKANIATAQTVQFSTTLSGNDAANYYVDSFVVYDILDKTFEIVTPNAVGGNVYEGAVYVDSDCYIVPIFFHTDEYLAANSMVAIDMYFDATAIQGTSWGPFVSAYAYGSDEYAGVWTGQLMIPTPDGKSFYTQLEVPALGSTQKPQGVVFNNYIMDNCVSYNAGAFGVSSTNLQTYDFREPVTLYEEGYEVITFVAKTSDDGYHGDSPNGQSVTRTVTSSTNAKTGGYIFDYLYSRDGVTPMDFNGDKIENVAKVDGATNADYYVITRGDVYYTSGQHSYGGDSNYGGKWSVEWYVFDSTGTYITNILSDGLYNSYSETQTYLLKALGLTKEQAAGKVVAISYEAPNNDADTLHQLAYDGQWYGNMLDHTVTGQVKVGFASSIKTTFAETDVEINADEENPHIATYGEGYVVNPDDGSYHQSLDITMDYGEIDLHAVRKDGYAFVGWYTQLADGSYKQVSTAFDYHEYINLDETYYAIFREVAEGEVIINHSTYNNPNDPAIPSHGGMSQMSVKVTDSDGTVYDCTPSTSRTSVTFSGDEELTYTVEITTTPLLNGEFFAWYTDSTNADGTKTYEEVFTTDDVIGSTNTVTASFTYRFSPTSQRVINIYSDVKRVSNTATLQYKYYNRFENLLTYTVKDIPLSDEECLGCEGNGGNAYFPSYLTLYTFMDGSGNEYTAYEGTDDYNTYKAAGYTVVDTYNKISAYAPKSDVTEVFDGTVQWIIDDDHLTVEKSLATLFATQDVPEYTINYTMPDHTDGKVVESNVTAKYNTLVNITAPQTDLDGNEFSYWYEPATGEILTYSIFYNYRIVEKKNIVAVYGITDLQEWGPAINSVTITREFSDNSDYIYNDFLLAFNNTEAKEIETALSNGEVEETGLLVLRKDSSYISDAASVSYPDVTDSTTQNYLKRVANEKKKNMAIPVTHDNETTRYNCYYYNLKDYDYTNLNRLNFFVQYDNNADIDGTHRYYECAYTAVAYIIVDGVVYLSNPKNVEFFELGKEAPTLN